MKNVRGFGLGLALGLGLAVSSVGFAQSATQFIQNSKLDSCCSTASCCKGDSCSMKDQAKKEHTKSHLAQSGKHDSCCGGDSCDMKMKHDMQDKPKV